MYPKGRSEEDYDLVKIKGKHGMINLMVPKWESTQEETDKFYRIVAEVRVDEYRRKQKATE